VHLGWRRLDEIVKDKQENQKFNFTNAQDMQNNLSSDKQNKTFATDKELQQLDKKNTTTQSRPEINNASESVSLKNDRRSLQPDAPTPSLFHLEPRNICLKFRGCWRYQNKYEQFRILIVLLAIQNLFV